MENPADYQYDIDVVEVAELWRRGSVVGSWLLDLPLMYYGDNNLSKSMEEYQTVVKVVGLFTLLWISVYQPLLYLLPYLKDLIKETWRVWKQNLKWNALHVWWSSCSVMYLNGPSYPLYYPHYISGYERVKITTTTRMTTMEMEPLTNQL